MTSYSRGPTLRSIFEEAAKGRVTEPTFWVMLDGARYAPLDTARAPAGEDLDVWARYDYLAHPFSQMSKLIGFFPSVEAAKKFIASEQKKASAGPSKPRIRQIDAALAESFLVKRTTVSYPGAGDYRAGRSTKPAEKTEVVSNEDAKAAFLGDKKVKLNRREDDGVWVFVIGSRWGFERYELLTK